jgi:hypothetical protein
VCGRIVTSEEKNTRPTPEAVDKKPAPPQLGKPFGKKESAEAGRDGLMREFSVTGLV